jgi:hypothetical protein
VVVVAALDEELREEGRRVLHLSLRERSRALARG